MTSRADILSLIRQNVHHPATARELSQLLRVPREERATFKRHLKSLVSDGELLQIRGNRFGLPDKMDLVVGRLQTNPAGFGFVVPEHPSLCRAADRRTIGDDGAAAAGTAVEHGGFRRQPEVEHSVGSSG